MHVELLDRHMVDSDIGVVNAARCSFDKQSNWLADEHHEPVKDSLSQADIKLISYLAKHQHWTPFGHCQEVFTLSIHKVDALFFLIYANLSGFEWVTTSGVICTDSEYIEMSIRGSIYAWITNLYWLPRTARTFIESYIKQEYPVSYRALIVNIRSRSDEDSYSSSAELADNKVYYDSLISYTLRITCPIFVKRQLETHRRNFVMTDIEDFAQNEVSRRYVDKEPEMWYPKRWRLQSDDKKQGSNDDCLDGIHKILAVSNYRHIVEMTKNTYASMNSRKVAHELSRAILPLSTYTTFWWTGSVKSWHRMFSLRLEEHAQAETRQIAQMCYDVVQEV